MVDPLPVPPGYLIRELEEADLPAVLEVSPPLSPHKPALPALAAAAQAAWR